MFCYATFGTGNASFSSPGLAVHSQAINPAAARCSAAERTVAGTFDCIWVGAILREHGDLPPRQREMSAGNRCDNDRYRVCGMGSINEPNMMMGHIAAYGKESAKLWTMQ